MTAQSPEASSSRGTRRSWLLPIYVAVIAISLIVVVRLLTSGDDEPVFQEREPDPEVTAFWVDHGRALVARWRQISPGLIQDVNDGGTCLPSLEAVAARCPELGSDLAAKLPAADEVVADAKAVTPPPDSSASRWLELQIEAWEGTIADMRRFVLIANDGFDEPAWRAALADFQEASIERGAADLQMVEVLAEVPADVRNPEAVNP